MPFVSRKSLLSFTLLIVLAALLAVGFLWSGLYDIGADDPHLAPVHAALQTLRERSVAVRVRDLKVPDLSDAALIRQGAGNYAAMCTGCHLTPGGSATELSRGLYPSPPQFVRGQLSAPARQFWTIKHGIKASGMPAWGKSMDDHAIWGLVAFVQRMPALDAAAYQALVESSEGHSHGPGVAGGMTMAEGHHHDHAHMEAAASEHEEDEDEESPTHAAGPAAVVDRFGRALAKGDLDTVKALLDPQVLVLESGGTEQSRDEYLSQHAPADAAFLRDAKIHAGRRRVQVEGDFAWVASESELHAQAKGKQITLQSTETMVLRRDAGVWHIVHIHWSSQRGP